MYNIHKSNKLSCDNNILVERGEIAMLEKIIQKNTEKSKISEQLKGLREQLTLLENKIKTAGVPVIITFYGWSAAGKGSMISDQQVMTLPTLWTKRVSRFRP